MAIQTTEGAGLGSVENFMRGLTLDNLSKITSIDGEIIFKVIDNKVVCVMSPASLENVTGASAVTNGAKGIVPAPLAGEHTYFLRGDGTWANGPQGNPAAFVFFADSFDNPVNSDWAVNSLAPVEKDNVNASLNVRSFDDTTEEGVGWLHRFPNDTLELNLRMYGKAKTAPGSTVGVVLKLYYRKISHNTTIPSWSNLTLTTLSIPNNANPQIFDFTIDYTTIGATAGDLFQFELTRDSSNVSDTLVGDFFLISVIGESS